MKLLHDRMLKYNWVGFYMLEETPMNSQPRILALGPFQGAMTPHTRIPLNQGTCGAVVCTGQTVVVDDVTLDNRYLACSTETKSEIVVPVFVRERVVGELDIYSHFRAAFGDQDRKLVEYCTSLVGKQLEKSGRSKMRIEKKKAHAREDRRVWPSFKHPNHGTLLPEVTCRP